jgi:hypothetical protein
MALPRAVVVQIAGLAGGMGSEQALQQQCQHVCSYMWHQTALRGRYQVGPGCGLLQFLPIEDRGASRWQERSHNVFMD